MLLGVGLSGLVCLLLALRLRPRLGFVTGFSIAAFLWTVACIGVLTLVPAYGVPEVVPAEGRATTCSMDYGGPAPEGFWIVSGGQRLLNVLVFVPAGAFLVLALARWRAAWVLAPAGLVGLVLYSILIERAQLELARIDRACDITDVVDNATGAVLGFAVGLLLAMVLRPWRGRRRRRPRGQ